MYYINVFVLPFLLAVSLHVFLFSISPNLFRGTCEKANGTPGNKRRKIILIIDHSSKNKKVSNLEVNSSLR